MEKVSGILEKEKTISREEMEKLYLQEPPPKETNARFEIALKHLEKCNSALNKHKENMEFR